MSDKIIIRTTCPRDCYDACGIAVVKRADGLVKVLGDPEHAVVARRAVRQMRDCLQRRVARSRRRA